MQAVATQECAVRGKEPNLAHPDRIETDPYTRSRVDLKGRKFKPRPATTEFRCRSTSYKAHEVVGLVVLGPVTKVCDQVCVVAEPA
jgi:hypothetical protein